MSIKTSFALLGSIAVLGACAGQAPPVAAPAPAAAPTPPVVQREAPPAPLPDRPIQLPAFTERTLPNGLQLVVVEHQGQPLVNLNLYVRSGSSADPVEKLGLAGLTAEVLTKGTRTRTARQIAETIEGVGGSISAGASQDYTSVTAGVLAEHLPLAFRVMSDVVRSPAFPAAEVETSRKQTLSGLQAQLSQPGAIAQRRFAEEVYGKAHPYGRAPLPGTVSGLTRADLVAFHRRHFTPANALLVISGAVTPDRAEALAREHFGAWTGAAPDRATFGEPRFGDRTRIALVNRPGSVQSTIMLGHPAVRPDNPDFFALQVLNQVLGGGPESRLFQTLRQERGWTYGAYSTFTRPQQVGVFRANADVRTPVTDSAVAEFIHQLETVRSETVDAEELRSAKNFLAGSFPLGFETPGQIAGRLATYRLLGLPADYMRSYVAGINAVTAADVQRVAQRYLQPERATIVVVGDAPQVLAGLERIAPVSLYDVEGNPFDRSALEVRASGERLDASGLQPVTLTYEFQVQGNAMGTVTSKLEREGDVWVGRTTLAGPIQQDSEVRFGADFTPISSKQKMVQGPMTIESDFRFEGGRVVGTAKMPEQMGGERAVDTEVPAGTLLPSMDEYALQAADLEVGKTLALPVFSAQSGGVVNATFKVEAVESVTVPAGTFQAYRIAASVGPQGYTIWARQDAPHYVLKQEFTGQPIGIALKSIANP